MVSNLGCGPLTYRKLKTSELTQILELDLCTDQIEKFLDPLDKIIQFASTRIACNSFFVEDNGNKIGFFVVHPDPKDQSCWWLGWLAMDRNQQGKGRGSATISYVLRMLRKIPGCVRIKLLVSPQNLSAIKLYNRSGFHKIGAVDGDYIFEQAMIPLKTVWLFLSQSSYLTGKPPQKSKQGRLRNLSGPHVSRTITVERGPPAFA